MQRGDVRAASAGPNALSRPQTVWALPSQPRREDGGQGAAPVGAAGRGAGLGVDPTLIAGRYQRGCLLGRGGMASVYAARDRISGRPVALKILLGHVAHDPRVVARFEREAKLTAELHHPNIVEMHDFGRTRTGLIYLVMELLEGENLRETLAREGSLPWARARALILDICAGLEAAHRAGIIHRDLKPSNCFCVDGAGRESVRLVDFGVARHFEGSPSKDRLTLAGHIVGTPDYMSPEQARGEELDPRSDLYAAGLILGEMLTGVLPYAASTPYEKIAAHLYQEPRSLAELRPEGAEFPAELEAIHARALRKDRDERYPDVASFARALRRVGKGGSTLRYFDVGQWTVFRPRKKPGVGAPRQRGPTPQPDSAPAPTSPGAPLGGPRLPKLRLLHVLLIALVTSVVAFVLGALLGPGAG